MSDLICAAYFIVGGFFAGPVVRTAYDDMRRDDDNSREDDGAKLMFLVIVAAFAWLAWPLVVQAHRRRSKNHKRRGLNMAGRSQKFAKQAQVSNGPQSCPPIGVQC